jgi:hypothetical protein
MIKITSLTALILMVVFFLSVLIHEMGHALITKSVGYNIDKIYIFPGYQLYPKFGDEFIGEWPHGQIAFTQIRLGTIFESIPIKEQIELLENGWRPALIQLMGSGLTWFVSVMCLITLRFLKPWSILFYLMLVGSVFYYDIVFYVIFPYYFEVPHMVFWGGDTSEPVVALNKLGLDMGISAVLILLICSIQTIYLVRFIHDCRPSNTMA